LNSRNTLEISRRTPPFPVIAKEREEPSRKGSLPRRVGALAAGISDSRKQYRSGGDPAAGIHHAGVEPPEDSPGLERRPPAAKLRLWPTTELVWVIVASRSSILRLGA
jgi:hypothetical protein